MIVQTVRLSALHKFAARPQESKIRREAAVARIGLVPWLSTPFKFYSSSDAIQIYIEGVILLSCCYLADGLLTSVTANALNGRHKNVGT